jgi:hypothetical protein
MARCKGDTQRVGKKELLKDAVMRLRAADRTSNARSRAFMVSLCLVQRLIMLLGVAASVGSFGLTESVADNIGGAVPGRPSRCCSRAGVS